MKEGDSLMGSVSWSFHGLLVSRRVMLWLIALSKIWLEQNGNKYSFWVRRKRLRQSFTLADTSRTYWNLLRSIASMATSSGSFFKTFVGALFTLSAASLWQNTHCHELLKEFVSTCEEGIAAHSLWKGLSQIEHLMLLSSWMPRQTTQNRRWRGMLKGISLHVTAVVYLSRICAVMESSHLPYHRT